METKRPPSMAQCDCARQLLSGGAYWTPDEIAAASDGVIGADEVLGVLEALERLGDAVHFREAHGSRDFYARPVRAGGVRATVPMVPVPAPALPPELVNHPSHYNRGGALGPDGSAEFETIKLIEDLGWGFGFCMGCALKYILRAPHKDADTEAMRRDLHKAHWYLRRALRQPQCTQLVTAVEAQHFDYIDVIDAWKLEGPLRECVIAISTGCAVEAISYLDQHMGRTDRGSNIW